MSNKQETAKSQETVVGNEVTNKILDRYGVKTVTQDQIDNGEKDIQKDVPAVEDQAQVKENDEETIELSEAELQALEESGIPEEELSGKTMKEIKALAVDKLPKQDTKSQDQKVIISDSYADQLSAKFPFAKNLRGKSLEEVMEIIQNQNSYITSLEQRKGENKSEPIINNKQETEDEVSEDSDVLDILTMKPEDATKKINDLIAKRANDIFEKKFKEALPNIEPLQKASQEALANQFYQELGSQLPEGTDPKVAFDNWKSANEDMSREEKMALAQNPSLLIKLISKEYALDTTSKKTKEMEKSANTEMKKKTYENLRKLLKDSQKLGSNATFNYKRKGSEELSIDDETGDPAKDMMGKIISRNLGR